MTRAKNTLYHEYMVIGKMLFLVLFGVCRVDYLGAMPLVEHFKQTGYKEIYNTQHGALTFNALYSSFDALIEFFHANPVWVHTLYKAKERFLRSEERQYYSTDFFGWYDEAARVGRHQISFYYSIHFHKFIVTHYPEFNHIPEIIDFFQLCYDIQQPCTDIFNNAASELELEAIFSSQYHPPVLLKVIKYFPEYTHHRPHYDGTALSLFIDSTDPQSLLLSRYKSTFFCEDFSSPPRTLARQSHQSSMLLIPGTLFAEFGIYPTPHIVVQSGKTRYATIAFAMRPHYIPQKNEFSPLPIF